MPRHRHRRLRMLGDPPSTATRGPPPPDFFPNESALDRQQRTRPTAEAPLNYDVDYRMRLVCLEQFTYGTDAWRLQCKRQFRNYCRENAVRIHVRNQRFNAPIEPLCAVCRGPGLAVAARKCAGHHGAEDLPNSRGAVEEIEALRGEFTIFDRAVRQMENNMAASSAPAAPAPAPDSRCNAPSFIISRATGRGARYVQLGKGDCCDADDDAARAAH